MKTTILPSGNYRIRLYIGTRNGKKQYKSFTASSAKEARSMAREYAAKYKNIENGKITVKQAMDAYINARKNVLSPSTVDTYKKTAQNYLKSIAGIELSCLTGELIQQAIDLEAATHSPKTVRNINGLLMSALKVHGISFGNIKLPQKKKSELYIPSKEDISALLRITKGTKMEIPIIMGAFMGMRRSEICAAEYSDIRNGQLRINKAMVVNGEHQWIVKGTKTTSSTRTVDLSDMLPPLAGTGRIVKLCPDTITRNFCKVLRENGLPKFRFHDLRHYYASTLLSLNVPNKYAQKLMGHATDNMLKTVYQHIMKDKEKEVRKQIKAYFSNAYFGKDDTKDDTNS